MRATCGELRVGGLLASVGGAQNRSILRGRAGVGLAIARERAAERTTQWCGAVNDEVERLAPVEQKLNHIHNILVERIDKIESIGSEKGLRIDKLEQLVLHAEGTPRSHMSERSVQLEDQINDLQPQVAALRTSESTAQQVGGLDALPSLQHATRCAHRDIHEVPSVPRAAVAKFRSSVDRDTEVELLRGAEMHESGKRVRATHDLPTMQRVQKIFIIGLRWQLGELGVMQREMEWDDKVTSLNAGRLGKW